ncbi:MAG: undecaprenyldiphospho-muramoylpentapeptide beta-N-acetylglucosaminyltransferase [Labilithrix sp.]|nr:undecaprenyldiphospho-muramoylpentapeptide beta-N-acetylglucosaminyltransferase [Labilithrix sp.]MCW5811971.1 undecaprenyldiphospho-muramoylpentapeptide beta-N-acetylglucosaminyltransferase [Labilithrix sp.]
MPRAILIAGGGTGGHVFPGLAIARALGRLADVEVVFAGTPRGLEAKVIPEAGYPLELLDVQPMKGGGPERAIRGALIAAQATRKARAVVRRIDPAAVLSVGGYAAGPAALACVAQRVPLAVLEPNSTLGLANRILAPFAKRAYLAWAETGRHFRGDKARVYGVPLRPGFEPRAYAPASGPKRVLVLGGSQGALALNEVVPKALLEVGRTMPLAIVHQAGRDREVSARAAYAGADGVEIVPFLDDVARRMADADLVIGRSGASTVAELSAIGRASLLIPFPYAADDHQAKNARSLADVGGALSLRQEDADAGRLAQEIAELLGDDARRTRMADAARGHGRPRAADDIARDLLSLAGIGLKESVAEKESS